MQQYIAERFRNAFSGLSLDTEALRRYSDVIDLSIGDTDFTTDRRIIDAAYADACAGYTHYGDPKGDPELIEAICQAWKEDFNQDVSPAEVLVTTSSCMGMSQALLALLNQIKPVWVELGLQTVFDETARYIRRGYALPVFADAVARLKAAGLTVIVHQILGLPGETPAQMRQTTAYIAHAGVDGIKLQLLHVLEGTDLAADWRAGRVPVLTLEKYILLLCDCVRLLPPEMVIHRLTGDGPKRLLLAPQWSGDKKRVLNAIRQEFIRQDVRQGQWYRG